MILNKQKHIPKKSNNTFKIKNFKIIASALAKCEINILSSKDYIGGYYANNLILPENINISNNKKINKLCYIYKIIFLLTAKKFNFYSESERENLDYIMLMALLIIKKINKYIFKNYPRLKNKIKKLYAIVIKKRKLITFLQQRILLLEIILKKLTYNKINEKIILKECEKKWIFKIENTLNLTEKNLTKNTDILYEELCSIHKKYAIPDFFLLCGYIYKKTKKNIEKLLKNNIRNNIKKCKNKKSIILIKKTHELKSKKNILYPIFDYKKTHENYNNNNRNTDKSTSISENQNNKSITTNDSSINLIINSKIINEIKTTKIDYQNINKKTKYKEWDYQKNAYKNNWCTLFVKKLKTHNTNKNYIDIISKKHINEFKKKLKLIVNRKKIQKKQNDGENIDLDCIIDNYKDVLTNTFNKVYTKKYKSIKNISLITLIDSSMSTESYTNEIETFKQLKNIANIINHGVSNLIKLNLVAAFYSNTRYDCRFIMVKDFNEKWNDSQFLLNQVIPTGYTRIGPAIRHSISLFKKIKTEKKIILLLSDGHPTDYDEYEGLYGINDIRKSITEANKKKINVKTILINNYNIKNFTQLFGKNNYYTISYKKNICSQLIQFFNSMIKN